MSLLQCTTYQESKSVPSEEIIHQTARKVLLTPEEVKFWFEHLHQIHQNRKRGAKKAAETRKRKAKEKELTQNIQVQGNRDLQQTVDEGNEDNEHCMVCQLRDPASDNEQGTVSWIQCDVCLRWCHVDCVGLIEKCLPEMWICCKLVF